MQVPRVELLDGTSQPAIGFGTYKVGVIPASASAAAAASAPSRSAHEVVGDALSVGYRFFDAAAFYGNEVETGKALTAAGIPRSELYIASKVWTNAIYGGAAAVRASVEKSIKDLNCGYLDLCLIHWPVPGKHVEAYRELEACKRDGLIISCGVSNYTVEDYQELTADSGVNERPVVNQLEVNPFLYRKNTLTFFESQGVKIQSYRALRDGKAFDHPVVVQVATAAGKTPAQVLGRWCVQKGFIYIPKSVKRERMEENAAVFDWTLDATQMAKLDSLTSEAHLATFKELYRKCVVRDTPLATAENPGTKENITVD